MPYLEPTLYHLILQILNSRNGRFSNRPNQITRSDVAVSQYRRPLIPKPESAVSEQPTSSQVTSMVVRI